MGGEHSDEIRSVAQNQPPLSFGGRLIEVPPDVRALTAAVFLDSPLCTAVTEGRTGEMGFFNYGDSSR